ncbi:PREDICTED: uncharacterized protein LOC105557880 [Vollenhovia emeryi]|uniref:uncharacterized protein LOC105557880 n=1 Tax=Vollenhovia emeryi TaxID=411798 RepID=UPI0005F50382|nr:PREDICTED: uncharacterized protein LOC105557880 [Vollenhovia emeryi]
MSPDLISSSIIGIVALVATGTMIMAYIYHACGMFNIASYRIEQAINTFQKNTLKSENKIYKEISYAVDIHRKAMEFIDYLVLTFEESYFFFIVIGIICLSLNFLWATSYSSNVEQLIIPILIILTLYAYLFILNYVAQEITDHNEYVFVTVYNVRWYMAPLHVQKMILFLLQRGSKVFHVILGRIFVASMESAVTLLSTSISYFTVLHSMKKN